jgi:spore maturation protein CgeB
MSNYKNIKLFYVGHLDEHSNSFKRFQTYKSLVNVIGFVNIDEIIYRGLTRRIDHYFNFGLGTIKLNLILRKDKVKDLDVLLIDNRPFVFSSTINFLRKRNPGIKIVSMLTDDPNGKHRSGWRLLKKTARNFDIHFVQRIQNINELLALGANRVEICYRSFDTTFHRKKEEVQKNTSYDAGFIGSYEEFREESIKYLIEHGIKVQVIGDGWEIGKHYNIIRPFYSGKSVYGESYVECINQMKIALHFLRHGNRDEQDSRTFEIPACETPMIAEFSEVHRLLFQENHEVLFFKNNEELLEKVNFFIKQPIIAEEFAQRAKKRCILNGYDHNSTLKRVLEKIQTIEKS